MPQLSATILALLLLAIASESATVQSRKNGAWSQATTWESGRAPAAGDVILVRAGHHITYDVADPTVFRAVHIAGVLTFAREKDTLLCAGLIRIAPGEECKEEGFDCHSKPAESATEESKPALEIGTPDSPIPAGRTAIIRLTYIDGMDKQSFPALVNCGGRLDLHGAPMNRTWVKLREHAFPGDPTLELVEAVEGWKPGDRVVLPTTEGSPFYSVDKTGRRVIGSVLDNTQTEEGEIANTSGNTIVLKQPPKFKHQAEGRFSGEIANLSRNVVVESADPNGVRGHTMYHRGSTGSISYAEFRHLGKEGVLGRYPIHFHLCGDTMRGSSVIGASIWDSANRWLTVHGTNYLIVRDCVGYRSIGHGYFFEDGTEVFNVLDRNIAIQALMGKPLPDQALPFDTNDAAGFWWANCLNSFTRNVAIECEKHGYRFQMVKSESFDPRLLIRQPDGSARKLDVRTLPFVRFEGNEARSQRRFALNLGGFHGQNSTEDLDRDGNVIDRIGYLGGDVQGVGPDEKHPFRIKDFLVWRSHWGFHSTAPNVLVDGFTANDVNYVVWRSNIAGHDYNHVSFQNIHVSTFFNNWGNGNSRADLLRYAYPEDTQPPTTVIAETRWVAERILRVSGVTADDSTVREVRVNGQLAELQPGSVTDWTALIPVDNSRVELSAAATDESGNVEKTPHRMVATFTALHPVSNPPPASHAKARSYAPASAATAEPIREANIDTDVRRWPLWDGKQSVTEYARTTGLPASRTVSLNGERLDLVLVPAGTFLMGSPGDEVGRSADEGPRHRVVISQPFYMGKVEVTQSQYAKVVGSNPSYFKESNRPVEQVSWHDAQNFIQKAGQGLRLPSEAEWEFAGRAGRQGCPSVEELRTNGWIGYNDELERAIGDGESHEIGRKPANAFGLHDMCGNVYEWCGDWYAPDYYRVSPICDPTGTESGDERVLRGGSWEAPPETARPANRNGLSPISRGYTVGFRVVLPLSN
jgi:formylglycine-generating enzyme required for sulfatase activity